MNAPDPAPIRSDSEPSRAIAELLIEVTPLSPGMAIELAADLFLQPELSRLLCLPVVNDAGQPVGTISRHELNNIFLRRFGRELFGTKPIARVMNAAPLVVDLHATLEDAAGYVTANLGSPITEDFIIVEDGRYRGIGVVLDLLSALQQRVERNARELEQAYRQLKDSQAQLVQSEKMASLGQMVAGVAHEINTPLGYVRNNVQMIHDVWIQMQTAVTESGALLRLIGDETADDRQLSAVLARSTEAIEALGGAEALDDVTALFGDTFFGVDSIRDLVVSLRNFSRLDQARVADIDINASLDQTLLIANNVLKSRVQIVRDYGELPPLRCSPSQINQVFLNLMTNAAQAIEHEQGELRLTTVRQGPWLQVHIADNGKGIPAEHLKKIFDPFFTTKPIGQGTGLGLSISFQIVQAHGGRIEVHSQPGIGTEFIVKLPLSEPGVTPAALQAEGAVA